MRYRYAGQDPQPDDSGGIVRPGEERDFGQEPDWGPWEPVDEAAQEPPEAPQPPPTPVPVPAPAGPPAATVAAPGGTSAPAPGEGI